MIKVLFNNLKAIASITLVIAALGSIGATVNSMVPWHWLTSMFVLIRKLLLMMDFMVDTETLIIIMGITISLEMAFWAFKGTMWVVKWFKMY